MKRRCSTLRKLSSHIADRRNRPVIYGVFFALASAATALACGWSYVTDHSVRFNSYRLGRGFYRMPPLPVMYDPKTGKDISVKEIDAADESGYLDAETAVPDLWEKSKQLVQKNDLVGAQAELENYLNESAGVHSGSGSEQSQRNSAHDMLDAIAALKFGSTTDTVREYLDARAAFHDSLYLAQEGEFPTPTKFTDKNLEDNWAYLKAATLYAKRLRGEALEAFEKHAAEYPRSEKNQAVLYMIGKIHVESSNSYEKSECETTELAAEAGEGEPVHRCRDENWQKALQAFQRLVRKYPSGRYSIDARSWLAYLHLHGGDQALAVAEYYRLLGHPTDRDARISAKRSLQYLGHDLDDAVLDRVEELIADTPDAALAYAYHRIYNYAVDLTYSEFDRSCCYGATEGDRWRQSEEEKKRITETNAKGRRELERISAFAAAMLKRYPNARVSGAFLVRIAEARMELQNFPDALTMARKALAVGVSGEVRREALWIKGSAEHQTKDLASARATFDQLVAEFPKGRLTEGARRLLALTAEDQDDLETALEQYLALNYEFDVAYYVDVLLPTERLARFVADRRYHPQRDYLLYALGVRYMRDRKWNEARDVLRQVRTEPGRIEPEIYEERDEVPFAKDPEWNAPRIIKTAWVMQDLKTIDTLEYMEQAVENAADDEARAEAMYQLASYQFEADDLLFYNPAAWQAQRYWLLADLTSSDRMRFPNEQRAVFDHSTLHEGVARSIPIYLDIVTRYPNTRAAKEALYSAAVAHERVSNLNPYWRNIYSKGLFAGPKYVGVADVRSLFPGYRLPRGKQGWEPSTRTVNGGPGWDPKPRPAPPLTRTQKFERRVKYVADKFEIFVRPKLDSARGWVISAVSGYISAVNFFLSWLLTIICLLLAGYGALVGYHFRFWLLAAARRLGGLEIALEQLPHSESRVEKVIDEGETDPV